MAWYNGLVDGAARFVLEGLMARLELRFLGGFEVLRGAETLRDFHTDKTRALLAYLAVEAARPHRRDVLACLLWPDQPEVAARTSLRQAVYRLRLVLDDHDSSLLIVTHKDIQLNEAGDYGLDVAQFTGLLARCRSHASDHQEPCHCCAQWWEGAVALYEGDFLAGLSVSASEAFESWLLLRQETYHRLVLGALHRLAIYHEQQQDYYEAETLARRQVELEPWRECAHRALMRILVLTGQRDAALHQYEVCRGVLASELGVAPSAKTTSLYSAICDGYLDV